uniref:Cytochrome P450 n=1 Tax=Ditylum brightwellii TaxID=49249 RepID=A0A7S2EK13_9STRA|mmetsp:Transcript_33700/g.50280  ORF Transcript_33700/g.50280 Transcript_33700/m.50280 type:complete len:611 (+) Transcript_33700:46-1878(+)
MKLTQAPLVTVVALLPCPSSAFIPSSNLVHNPHPFPSSRTFTTAHESGVVTSSCVKQGSSSTSLAMIPSIIQSIPSTLSSVISPVIQRLLLVTAAVAMALNARRILWPNIKPDPNVSEPLPTGKLGCPLFGNQVFIGSKNFGTGYFWHRMSKALGNPRVWMVYFMGRPGAVMSGGERIKQLLNSEFENDGVLNSVQPNGVMLDVNSMLAESHRKTHSYLRRLVGAALTPAAVTAVVPTLQASAEKAVEKLVTESASGKEVKSEEICTEYTMDVAWKSILGLNLAEEEVKTFQEKVDGWVAGFANLRIVFNVYPKSTSAYKCKMWLVKKIEEKIDYLEQNGPDESTLSGMVFATDDEGEEGKTSSPKKKLTREQIVENSLLLMLAGSETSASTLTNALLCLGLHPDKWDKLVQEQRLMQAKYGEDVLTRETLDKECPYLDAVIRETMRIKPLSSGAPRTLRATKVVDGVQIPKGWGVNWNVLLTHELDPITYKEDGSHMEVTTGFAPERWLDETTRPTTDFIPMGAGPRYCLGSTLAYTEMKCFLAVLARKIDYFSLVGDNSKGEIEWKRMSIIPKPEDGVPIMAVSSSSSSSSAVVDVESENPIAAVRAL